MATIVFLLNTEVYLQVTLEREVHFLVGLVTEKSSCSLV